MGDTLDISNYPESIVEIAADVELSTYRVQEIIHLHEFESDEYPASFVEVGGLIGLDRATLLFDSFPVSSRGCVYVPSYIEPGRVIRGLSNRRGAERKLCLSALG